MKFRKNKKGFTIVELIIVIAVIGILTAVMVPTIIHLVGKANKASDDALVSNLNKALAIRESETSKKPVTMHEAVESLEEYGYKVDALVARSDQSLLYDLKDNKFLLTDEAKVEKKADYWQIRDDANDVESYNIYASSKFAVENVAGLKVGFDAGEQKNISSIEYVGTENVLIRTNGGDVKVNAPEANVTHVGKAVDVKIDAVAHHSYYEQGVVSGSIYITKGHVVLAKQDDLNKAAASIVVKGADVQVETDDETPIIIDSDVEVTADTKINGVKGTDESFEEQVDATINRISNLDELKAAFAQGSEGGYYALSADITSNVYLPVLSYGDVSLDLNGHKIVYDGDEISYGFIWTYGTYGQLTISDTAGNGLIDVNGKAYSAIQVRGFGAEYADYPARLVVNGGEFKGNVAAITGNGSLNNSETDITINGGKFTANNLAIYHPQNGVLRINGGHFSALETALELRAGTLEINGGVFEATSSEYSCNPNGNGTTTVGAAVAIIQHTTKRTISARISDGLFKGHHALVMTDIQENETSNVSVSITGGKFEGKVENLADPNWVLVIS